MDKKILHLHVKKKYWEQVRDKQKFEEYRNFDLKLMSRLLRGYDLIYYHLGYPSKKQKDKTLVFQWDGFIDKKITHELFGKNAHVFAISLNKTLAVNKKEDYGLPPTDKSVGIRPTIL